jgi:hypothetical protein
MATTLFPAYYPLPAPPALPANLPPVRQQRPRLAPDCWPEIAARAEHESLRDLAVVYGVSHETVRAVVRRVANAAHALAMARDNI